MRSKHGEDADEVLKAKDNYILADKEHDADNPVLSMPLIDPVELIGRTFLMTPEEDGQRFCEKIVEAIVHQETQQAQHPDAVKFCCSINDDKYEEIVSYSQLLNHIENNESDDGTLKSIMEHEGPLH